MSYAKRMKRNCRALTSSSFSGQTLIEVLVAMTVGVLVLTAITSSVLTSLVNSRVSSSSSSSARYAQEGIEIARGSRSAAPGTYCLDKDEIRLTGTPEGECLEPNIIDDNDSFIRTVAVLGAQSGNDCGTGINKIIVTVKWTDGKCAADTPYCHNVVLSSCANTVAP